MDNYEYEYDYDADLEYDYDYYNKYEEYHKEDFVRWFYGKLKLDDIDFEMDKYYNIYDN